MEVAALNLLRALRLNTEGDAGWPGIALVGAGGKTTALFQLARQLAQQAGSALVTTSTHLAPEQALLADRHFMVNTLADLQPWLGSEIEPGVTVLTGSTVVEAGSGIKRLSGLQPALIQRLAAAAAGRGQRLLIEADGARQLPLKAPAEHEPVIPTCAGMVVVCAGLQGLGHTLDAASVHRPERFAALSGLAMGAVITPEALARVLVHPQGGLKGLLPERQVVLLLNQADTPELEQSAEAVTGQVFRQGAGTYRSVVVAALQQGGVRQVHEPVAGIVLAAGAAQRFGRPKQLVEVDGQPLVRRAAQTALQAGLSPVVVITGSYAEQVSAAVQDLAVNMVYNPDWAQGQSSSVRSGLLSLAGYSGGTVFLLADQPYVTAALLQALVRRHALTLAPVVAPRVDSQRANPVLFDRVTYADLLAVQGDVGGRVVLNSGRYPINWLDWQEASLLVDIDTEEDYRRLAGGSA